MISELEKDPNKRFVYVEMAYFSRWWKQQDDKMKQLVKTLVDEGRLEFVIGAWYKKKLFYSKILNLNY